MIIKFNAWDKEDKRMLSWDEIWKKDLVRDIFVYDGRYIPLQYSNRKDFIDEELYLGDIIKATDNEDSETFGEVIFKDNSFCIKWKHSIWGNDFIWELNWNDDDFRIEKQGNIYEGLKIDL